MRRMPKTLSTLAPSRVAAKSAAAALAAAERAAVAEATVAQILTYSPAMATCKQPGATVRAAAGTAALLFTTSRYPVVSSTESAVRNSFRVLRPTW